MILRIPLLISLLTLLWIYAPQACAQSQQWEAQIQAFEAADEADPPPKGGVLFIGSSSIGMWTTLATDFPSVPVINRGFGGSELTDVLHFADRIVLPYEPDMIFLYEGDNDVANGVSAAEVAAAFDRFVQVVRRRLPETRIAFIAIKPSPSRVQMMSEMKKANELIREQAASDELVEYVDVFTPMLDADGQPRPELFLEDALHMNEDGYALWKEIVAPYLP